MTVFYPPKPINVNPQVTTPTESFKKEVVKVVGAIALFVITYFVLILAAIGLAILSGFGGVGVIAAHPSFLTLMLGLGLIGLGIMVLFFLVKFIFKKVKVDRSHLMEIKATDQPELFDFIRKLTVEVGAPFPKRIYLSSDVNASVFYDSGFWSMFFPVRKNLQIGLGLVNAMTISEFKAVLAHEFGHFSQRSMKLGSYVYNVNQVIYNMLYDNEGYGEALDKWSSVSGYFAFFSSITIGIVKGIQAILRAMYGVINRSYMSLSRQMEFHADAVAASVAGSNQLASALLKLDLASSAHQRLLESYNEWVQEGLKAENMYSNHHLVMHHAASDLNIPIVDGLPSVDEQTYKRMASSRVAIHDQWASHPSTEDRVEQLNKLGLVTESASQSAWTTLRDPGKVQREMTTFLYREAKFPKPPVIVGDDGFRERFYADANRYQFPTCYQGFYDSRPMTNVTFEKPLVRDASELKEILTDAVLALPRKIELLTRDIGMLEAVQVKANGIKSFDLDGKRFSSEQAGGVLDELRKEQEMLNGELLFADSRIVSLAYDIAEKRGISDELKAKYLHWSLCEKEVREVADHHADIMSIMAPAYQGQLTVDQAGDINNKLQINEKKGQARMKEILTDESSTWVTEEEKEVLRKYLEHNRRYFEATSGFNNEGLDLLTQSMHILYKATASRSFEAKKNYLVWQAELISEVV